MDIPVQLRRDPTPKIDRCFKTQRKDSQNRPEKRRKNYRTGNINRDISESKTLKLCRIFVGFGKKDFIGKDESCARGF
jgi:hypothetical protein